MARINILCTRRIDPLLAGKAAVHGIRIKIVEFIRSVPLITEETVAAVKNIDPTSALIFTSSNAVEALHQVVRKFNVPINASAPVFAMDGKTSKKVRQYFPGMHIEATAIRASELAQKIIELKKEKLTFFCGNLRREELPEMIRQNGIQLEEMTVYATEPTPVQLTEEFDGIMFFSPSAVASFFELNSIKASTTCFAIGDTTAEALKKYTNNKIITATLPRQEQMVDMVIDHYKNT